MRLNFDGDCTESVDCFLKKFYLFYLILFIYFLLKISACSSPPASLPSSHSPSLSSSRSSQGSLPNGKSKVPCSPQVQEGEHPNRLGSHKACPCSRTKTQHHCPWLFSQPSLTATFRVSILITCSITPSPAGLGEFPLDHPHHHNGWAHPSGS